MCIIDVGGRPDVRLLGVDCCNDCPPVVLFDTDAITSRFGTSENCAKNGTS